MHGLGQERQTDKSLEQTIKALEDEIELTIYNYENILQGEKKNSSNRS